MRQVRVRPIGKPRILAVGRAAWRQRLRHNSRPDPGPPGHPIRSRSRRCLRRWNSLRPIPGRGNAAARDPVRRSRVRRPPSRSSRPCCRSVVRDRRAASCSPGGQLYGTSSVSQWSGRRSDLSCQCGTSVGTVHQWRAGIGPQTGRSSRATAFSAPRTSASRRSRGSRHGLSHSPRRDGVRALHEFAVSDVEPDANPKNDSAFPDAALVEGTTGSCTARRAGGTNGTPCSGSRRTVRRSQRCVFGAIVECGLRSDGERGRRVSSASLIEAWLPLQPSRGGTTRGVIFHACRRVRVRGPAHSQT
jgi:hypothetical protein